MDSHEDVVYSTSVFDSLLYGVNTRQSESVLRVNDEAWLSEDTERTNITDLKKVTTEGTEQLFHDI